MGACIVSRELHSELAFGPGYDMGFVTDIIERVRTLLFRRREEREMDDELRFHVEMEAEKNRRAGMKPAEARRQAMLAFGGMERFKEQVRDARGVRPLEDLGADLRYAWRKLRRAPGFAAVAILMLAVGIGASSAIFSVVYGVLMRSLPYETPERLVRVFETDRFGNGRNLLSPPNFMSLREARAFTDVAVYDYEAVTLTGRGDARWLEGAEISTGFFEVMGSAPILGRTFTEGENLTGNDAVAILGYALWQELAGGRPEILGQSLLLHGRLRTVVGVMPAGFDFPYGSNIWLPLEYSEEYSATSASGRSSNWLNGVARLREGVRLEDARAELAVLAEQLEQQFPVGNEGVRFAVSPLRDVLVASVRAPLLLLLGAVGLLLLIACANVAGLLLARSASRREELAARMAIGAVRGRIVRQLMVESLVIGTMGGALGLLLATWGTQLIVDMRPMDLPRIDAIRVDSAIVAFSLAVSLSATLLAGLVPALHATRVAPASVLQGGGRSRAATRAGARMRAGLVVTELALAVVLLAGAGLLLHSFLEVMSEEPGFHAEGALAFEIQLPETEYDEDAEIRSYYERLLEHLGAVPGVEVAGAAFRSPIIHDPFNTTLRVEGGAGREESVEIEYYSVTPGYFAAAGIPIRRGRGITDRDTENAPGVVVINETAAQRFFPGENPIGRRVWLGGRSLSTIVGVVGDVAQGRVTNAAVPEVVVAFAQEPRGRMDIVVRGRTADVLALAPMIRVAVREVDPSVLGMDFRALERIVADAFARQRFLSQLLALFASAALMLAAIGVFGLFSFTVAARKREIGIRVALGATRETVVVMVLRDTLKLTAMGLAIGIAGAVFATRLLQGMLYGVSAMDPATYAAVIALIALTATVAGLLPARRAAAVDPMVALRQE